MVIWVYGVMALRFYGIFAIWALDGGSFLVTDTGTQQEEQNTVMLSSRRDGEKTCVPILFFIHFGGFTQNVVFFSDWRL